MGRGGDPVLGCSGLSNAALAVNSNHSHSVSRSSLTSFGRPICVTQGPSGLGVDPPSPVDQGQQHKLKNSVDIWCVASDFFWGYIEMVNVLASIGNHLHSWIQACPCHRGDSRTGAHIVRHVPDGRPPSASASRAADLSASSQAEVSQYFEFGRQHMVAHIRVRGTYHSELPLLLFGVGHPNVNVARRIATDALQFGLR